MSENPSPSKSKPQNGDSPKSASKSSELETLRAENARLKAKAESWRKLHDEKVAEIKRWEKLWAERE